MTDLLSPPLPHLINLFNNFALLHSSIASNTKFDIPHHIVSDFASNPDTTALCTLDTLKSDDFTTIFYNIGSDSKDNKKIKKECECYSFFADDYFDKIDKVLTRLKLSRSKKKAVQFASCKSFYENATCVDIANCNVDKSSVADCVLKNSKETRADAKSNRPRHS